MIWQFRRLMLLGFIVSAAIFRTVGQSEPGEVTLDFVAKRAEERAGKPFRSPRADLPDILRADKLDYDKYREIRFRHEQALWSAEKLPFAVEFFHPGYLYEEPVHINEFSAGQARPLQFVQDFFDYGKLRIKDQIPTNTGYAGFKILYPINQPDKMDELGSFLGASYFRLLGKGQRYGQSARGLTLDSGESGRPEEFPIFTDWWLGKPRPEEKELHLFALLDSVSCTGAYEFHIRPGETTTASIDAIIYLRPEAEVLAVDPKRKPLLTIGLAPLTSMFWFGKNSERKFDDYRPEVHDSDGLLMRMENQELLWRPLNNASVMRHQRFGADNIRGFGLLQRERDFAAYQDLFNFYQSVPSVWVEPHGRWGKGDLHLLELSTSYEGLDNVVAFWDPKTKPAPMQPFRFGYDLYWTRGTNMKISANEVLATRCGVDPRNAKWRQFAVDFGGAKLTALTDDNPPQAIASCSPNGKIVETQVFHLPNEGTWRAFIKMEPVAGNTEPVDLRCTMQRDGQVLAETWTYLWSPP